MKLLFQIAFRFLFSRRSKNIFSSIGWITLIGLSLGVAAQNITLSIFQGFEKAFTDSILGFNAHLFVTREGEIANPPEVLKTLGESKTSDAIAAITPFLYREGLMTHRSKVKGVVLKGIELESFQKTYALRLRLYSSFQAIPLSSLFEKEKSGQSYPKILLGSDLADTLRVDEKNRIVLILSPQGDLKNISDLKNFSRFEVVGTFSSGLYEYDSQFALLDLKQAQSFFKVEGRVTGFEIRLEDPRQANKTAISLRERLGEPFQAVPWNELNGEVFKALYWEKLLFFILMGFLVLVAASNLVGLLLIFFRMQKQDLFILHALGMGRPRIRLVVFSQGLLVALLGIGLGSLIGWACVSVLSRSYLSLAKEVYLVSSLPLEWSWKNLGAVGGGAILLSFLTGWMTSALSLKKI